MCSSSFFFVAIARAVVNHDDGGGTAPHPLVWSAGSLPKRRDIVDVVRNFAFLPGPACLWSGGWVSFGVSGITVEDVRVWPYTVSLLVKVSAFLGTLHWPVAADDLGVGGVSFVELLILYELWAGERLSLEKAVPKRRRVGRPISVSAVPFGPGIDIWRSCRFFGAIFRALSLLPGGLGRFLPGGIGANHCRLRHIGWGKCSHGLTSRPRETSSVWFLDELLVLFGYPSASGASLLAGTLPLRFFSESFACRVPTWRLPEGGNVPSFLASRGLVWGGPNALSTALGRAGVFLGSGDDGSGTAPNPLVWSAGSLPKRRRVVDAVRNFAFLPGPVGIWSGDWAASAVGRITVDDVRVWPYSVSLLVKMSAFLSILHWPVGGADLGVGRVSFVELLILFELWAGERLCLERAVPK